MPVAPVVREIPNLVIEGWYEGILTGCTSCRDLPNPFTQGLFDGVLRPNITEGLPGELDFFDCTYQDACIDAAKIHHHPTWTVEGISGKEFLRSRIKNDNGGPWVLEFWCRDTTAPPGMTDFLMWEGEHRPLDAPNPAGYYYRTDGCSAGPALFNACPAGMEECPCGPFPDTCDITGDLQISPFVPAEWGMIGADGPTSCVGAEDCVFGKAFPTRWTGEIIDHNNTCRWFIAKWDSLNPADQPNARHMGKAVGAVPCGSGPPDQLVFIFGEAGWSSIARFWFIWFSFHTTIIGKPQHDMGLWAKDVGETPSGKYRRFTEDYWEFIAIRSPNIFTISCTQNLCPLGPDEFTVA